MISTLIATYNRSTDLRMVLECLRHQTLPSGLEHEVLIVDNNSNDDTKAVVESYFPSFKGSLKYLFEPRQGKSFAINKGIEAAKGDIIVLTDDDCTFESNYIASIYKVFQESGEYIGFIGGKVAPRWVNCSKPEWFVELKPGWWHREFFWGPLAIMDYGDEPFTIDQQTLGAADKKLFYGANMAVRRELFTKYGGFDLEKHNAHDTEFQLRFLKAGAKGCYVPQIKVYHKITSARLAPKHYYRWYYVRGKLLEVETQYQKKFYHPLGIQFALISKTLKLLIGSLLARSLTEKVYKRCEGLFNLGQMVQIAGRNIR